jgi:drug/metabolite transporter (DMT)-like permease
MAPWLGEIRHPSLVLTGAYPLVTLAFAALVLRERIMLLQWGCIVAILVGMFFCTS